DAVRGPTPRRRLSLPTYAFDRQRYWIEPGSRVLAASTADVSLTRIADLRDWFHRPVWRPSDLPPASAVARGRFVLFLDDDGPGAALAELLAAQGHEVARVVRGPAVQAVGKLRCMVNPAGRCGSPAARRSTSCTCGSRAATAAATRRTGWRPPRSSGSTRCCRSPRHWRRPTRTPRSA